MLVIKHENIETHVVEDTGKLKIILMQTCVEDRCYIEDLKLTSVFHLWSSNINKISVPLVEHNVTRKFLNGLQTHNLSVGRTRLEALTNLYGEIDFVEHDLPGHHEAFANKYTLIWNQDFDLKCPKQAKLFEDIENGNVEFKLHTYHETMTIPNGESFNKHFYIQSMEYKTKR